jgi:uncharacterized protein (DUF58 family)
MSRIQKIIIACWEWLTSHGDEISIMLITAFLMIVAANTQAGLLYILNAVLLAFLVTGFILPRAALKHLALQRFTDREVYEGQQARIRIKVRNTGKHSKYLISLFDNVPFKAGGSEEGFLIHRLPPGGEEEIEYSGTSHKRGRYEFKGTLASTSAPFGIFNALREVSSPGLLTVFPTPFPFDEIHIAPRHIRSLQEGKTQPICGYSHDFLGVREYQPGEDMRYIHWRSSARAARLMLQEFMKPGGALTAVFVDTLIVSSIGEGVHNTLEYAVKIATAFLHFSRKSGATLRFITPSGGDILQFTPWTGNEGLDFLAGLEATGAMEWRTIIDELPRRIPPGSTLIITTPQIEFTEEFIQESRARKIRLLVFLLEAPTFSSKAGPPRDSYVCAAESLRQAGISSAVVRRLEDPGQ